MPIVRWHASHEQFPPREPLVDLRDAEQAVLDARRHHAERPAGPHVVADLRSTSASAAGTAPVGSER